MKHHPIFDRFSPYSGHAPVHFHVCFIGDRVRNTVVDWAGARLTTEVAASIPGFDEEYFEWIDLLEAVESAGDMFTMLELGAGYGRWSSRGAWAARQKGKQYRLGLIEADPKHVAWIHEHMADNEIPRSAYAVTEAAIDHEAKKTTFAIAHSEPVKNWFGQFAVGSETGQFSGFYHGKPKKRLASGFEAISVRCVKLSEVLRPWGRIDLADFDLQGAEASAICEAIDELTAKVKRLHIGTHGPEIEDRLRGILSGAGWKLIRDYPCQGQNIETDYGAISFVDGVQSWVNPTL